MLHRTDDPTTISDCACICIHQAAAPCKYTRTGQQARTALLEPIIICRVRSTSSILLGGFRDYSIQMGGMSRPNVRSMSQSAHIASPAPRSSHLVSTSCTHALVIHALVYQYPERPMSLMNLLAMPVSVCPTDPASCFIELRSCLACNGAHTEFDIRGGAAQLR